MTRNKEINPFEKSMMEAINVLQHLADSKCDERDIYSIHHIVSTIQQLDRITRMINRRYLEGN